MEPSTTGTALMALPGFITAIAIVLSIIFLLSSLFQKDKSKMLKLSKWSGIVALVGFILIFLSFLIPSL